jgi:hypothetical protein
MDSSLLIHFQPDKKELLLALLKEFSFIKEIEVLDDDKKSYYEKSIEESEDDIKSGKLTSQKDLESEILKWRKK